MKEKMILQSLRRKDPRALEWVMGKYSAYVSAVVWNILKTAMTVSDAEEAASDVFLALWNQAEEVRPGKLKAWLASVARNLALRKLREAGKELPLEADFLETSDGSSPELILEEEEQRRAVRKAVEALEEPDREIFLRHYYYIQPVREISRDMGMKESTVKSRLMRGRQKLKAVLQEWGAV